MKKLILASAMSVAVLGVAACGDNDAATETEVDAPVAAVDDTAAGANTASADWPAGTRIVEEGGVTYRVDPGGSRVAIDDGSWRIVTEDGERYRVDDEGTRIRIDDDGLDIDLDEPDIPGVDVDVGTNTKGNLDVDVSTDGTDASNDRPGDAMR